MSIFLDELALAESFSDMLGMRRECHMVRNARPASDT